MRDTGIVVRSSHRPVKYRDAICAIDGPPLTRQNRTCGCILAG